MDEILRKYVEDFKVNEDIWTRNLSEYWKF